MPLAYADTSFLIALYGNDNHTRAARAVAVSSSSPLLLCELSRLEFENALRLLRFRKLVETRFVNAALAAARQDEQAGLLRAVACDWPAVFMQAQGISTRHTMKEGHRTMDILHVAAARTQLAKHFFSFDERQRKLAAQEGLSLNP